MLSTECLSLPPHLYCIKTKSTCPLLRAKNSLTSVMCYIITSHRFMEKLRWWLGQVTCLRERQCEENEVTGGISPFSSFPLTSCPVAHVYCCCLAGKHVRQGDMKPLWKKSMKSLQWWNSSIRLRNFRRRSSPPSSQRQPRQHGYSFFFFFCKYKREVELFYFSFHMQVPAFLQVIWGFSHLLRLFF